MGPFNDQEDVEEWLAPMDYRGFWRESAAFALDLLCRDNCDRLIAAGKISEADILVSLKGLARLELVLRYQLPVRDVMPWHALH